MANSVKHILSSNGWESKNDPIDRRKSLQVALEDENIESVIYALKWVERKWSNTSSGISDICLDDINWIKENFIQDKDKVKRKNPGEDIFTVKKNPPTREVIACDKCDFKARYQFTRCPECNELRG